MSELIMRYFLSGILLFAVSIGYAQTNWVSIDSLFGNLPGSFHVYKSMDSVNGKPNIMYYARVNMTNPAVSFSSDTSKGRRLTPRQFYEKNRSPYLVVNAGFFSFENNSNLNAVVINGKLVSFNAQHIRGTGADSGYYLHPFYGTFGILESGEADVAWTLTDSSSRKILASQHPIPFLKTKDPVLSKKELSAIRGGRLRPWRVVAAVGGGPVLVQEGKVRITNEEERKFYGKAIYDRHPRTAIGYTKNNELIVFVCEGRSDSAAGLTLPQMAKILRDIGCEEALNLDGGGSTSMLINGIEVNTPSSKGVQRPVPSVFLVNRREVK